MRPTAARTCCSRSAPRRSLPRGEPERATGLFRANREHRLASTGARDLAVDPGDGAGGAQPAQRERARQQWPEAGSAKPRATRRHLGSGGLRDSLAPILLERGPPEMMVRTRVSDAALRSLFGAKRTLTEPRLQN